jgi:hypothetical protein
MKIYIENYNLNNIISKCNILDKFLFNTKTQIDIYSAEGLFIVDNTKLFKLKITDKKTCKIENYFKKNNIIMDDSNVDKEITYQLPQEHIAINLTIFTYKICQKSKISLVIEGTYNQEPQIDKYIGFEPSNFYFISYSNIIEIKDNLCEFLSLLN